MTRERLDRDGLRLQVYAGRDPLTGRNRWVSRPVPGKGWAELKRAKQVEAELLVRAAGQHRGSRTKTLAELIERWLEGRLSVRPICPTSIAVYRGAIDRSMCRPSPRSRSRPAGAATLDTFYPACASRRQGRPAACSQLTRKSEPRRSRLATEFGLRHVPGEVGVQGRIPLKTDCVSNSSGYILEPLSTDRQRESPGVLRVRSALMVLALKQLDPIQIPTNTSGAKDFPCEHTFATKINQVDVVVKEFKLDQVGAVKPIEIVQVGARQVRISTSDNKKVTFTIRVNLKNGANYTGEVSPLIIADVAP